jgi:hypothetical protein
MSDIDRMGISFPDHRNEICEASYLATMTELRTQLAALTQEQDEALASLDHTISILEHTKNEMEEWKGAWLTEHKAHEATKAELAEALEEINSQIDLSDLHTFRQWQRRVEQAESALAAMTESRKEFLRDISDDMECLPTCTSDMHDDACPVAFPAQAWRKLREELAAMTAERDELRLEEAPWTVANYWEIYEPHQSPYTRLDSLDGNPLKLKPGQSRRVALVVLDKEAE